MPRPLEVEHDLRQAQSRAYHSRLAWGNANDAGNADLAASAARVYEADVREVMQLRSHPDTGVVVRTMADEFGTPIDTTPPQEPPPTEGDTSQPEPPAAPGPRP